MMLIMVSEIGEIDSLNEKLGLKDVLNKQFKTTPDIYRAFRKIVPKGRYSLAIAETGKNGQPDKSKPLLIMDTQLMQKDLGW